MPDPFGLINPIYASFLWLPKMNQSFEGRSLRIRNLTSARGLGCRAPSHVSYEIKPEYKRVVALAGIADNMLDGSFGEGQGMYPSVRFRVFIDGRLAAESPVMRITQAPWPFDVAHSSRQPADQLSRAKRDKPNAPGSGQPGRCGIRAERISWLVETGVAAPGWQRH